MDFSDDDLTTCISLESISACSIIALCPDSSSLLCTVNVDEAGTGATMTVKAKQLVTDTLMTAGLPPASQAFATLTPTAPVPVVLELRTLRLRVPCPSL
ncbi:MAG: hypothetical protein ABIS36_19835 [Chryseolinea sp.]